MPTERPALIAPTHAAPHLTPQAVTSQGRSRPRVASALLTAVYAAIAIAACGGAGSAEVVAHVGDRPITRGAVEHWTHIVAVKDYSLKPTSPVPKWVVPDPPSFNACIAHLKVAGPSGPSSTHSPSSASPGSDTKLKARCKARYEEVRQQAIDFLITAEALLQEGAVRGLTASPREVARRFAHDKELEFANARTFPRYLEYVGETRADQMFRARINLLTAKIEVQILSTKGQSELQRDRALVHFGETFPVRWMQKTRCVRRYVAPNCSEYRGPLKPRIAT